VNGTLKPYPAYKDSGVPWVSRVPEHWHLLRLDRLFSLRREDPQPGDDRVTAYIDGRVTLRRNVKGQKIKGVIKEAGWQRVHPGDFAISGMNAHLGGMGVSDSLGKCSPIYLVLVPKPGTQPHYVSHVVRHMARSGYIWSLMTTIRFNSADFKRDDLKKLSIWIPPYEEQGTIAQFVSALQSITNRYIRAQRRLIELLTEQKQALIQQAVTRGLDPHVKLKPSGIEWLGEIPEHWDERPAKYFFREIDERSHSGEEELLSVSHITGVTPRSQKNVTMFKAESYVGYKLCRADDLVINTMWAWMAALGVAKQTGIVSSSYAVYRPTNSDAFVSEYVDHLLRTKPYVSEYICRSTGIRSSRLRLYPEQFLKIPLICPPHDEQKKIVKFVEGETLQLDQTITRTQCQIDLIREYRTRLIADVVTGKLDVRGVAPEALLPDLDETGDLGDLDDLEEDAELDDLGAEELDDADD